MVTERLAPHQLTASSIWDAEIRPLLPASYQEQARRLGAWARTRSIPSIDALLRALLCYVLCARSLRQLGAWATVVGLGSISDRAWSRRVRQSTAWVLWLVGEVLLQNRALAETLATDVRIRIIDASMVRMRSHRGRSARLHCSSDLLERRLDHVVITDDHHAEGIHHFGFLPGEIVIADRFYCRPTTVAAVQAAQADLVVRWHSTNLPLRGEDGTRFDVVAWLDTIAGEEDEVEVLTARRHLRLIARRLSPVAAQREAYRRRRKGVKVGHLPTARTLVFTSWLLLVTTLTAEAWPREDVFLLYRARWQVEMLFKRLKQLVRLHGLPSRFYPTNKAILALTMLGWALLDRQEGRLRPHLSATSAWQCAAMLLDALRSMLWGIWTWTAIAYHLDALARYLRPSRPPHKLWSAAPIQAHLARLLQIA